MPKRRRTRAAAEVVEIQLAEGTRVHEAQLGSVVEIDNDVGVFHHLVARFCDPELHAHAEMADNALVVVEIEDQKLAVASHVTDRATRQPRNELLVRLAPHGAVAPDRDCTNSPPDERGFEVAADRLDLG